MRPAEIETLIAVGRPDIARDGSFGVFATSRPDLRANRYVGQVWRVELPGGTARRVTRGVSDSNPRISPDGTRVLFVRGDAHARPQLFVIPAGGGEALQVTDAPLGVGEYAWTPDGREAVFLARVPEPGRYGTVPGLDAAAEPPRRITGVRWLANGLGYIGDRPAHVFVVPVSDPEGEPVYPAAPTLDESDDRSDVPVARRLTEGSVSYGSLALDGRRVVVVAETIESGRRDLRSRIVSIDIDTGELAEVLGTQANLSVSELAASGGELFALAADVGDDGQDFIAAGTGLFEISGAQARRLTDPDSVDLGEAGSHLTVAEDGVLVQQRPRGRVHLRRVARDGRLDTVLAGDVEVTGHASGGGRTLAAVATADSFGELMLVDGRTVRRMTAFGTQAAAVSRARVDEHEIIGRDGYPVHGWSAVPEGDGPHPVILQIHGGPHAAYGIHLFDETEVLVDAGYAVLFCNPRGSAGYGRAHGRSIRRAMGTYDLHDVLDFVDAVAGEDPRLDAGRVGIMGGSYGGYLTAWAIAHDHRFAAAIVERGFLDPVSFQGTSDIGSFFGDQYVGTAPDEIAAQSPMAVVDRVRTPTLVIHSEADHRCPLEQATRYYSALTRQGVAAELLVFPGEDHELTRTGQPRHRVERFDAVLDWWARYLPVAP